MKQETIKIQILNDTTLCVRPVLPDGKTIVPIDDEGHGLTTDISVAWGINGHETEPVKDITFKDGYICIPINHEMPLGVYDVHITGYMTDGREVSDNRKAMFELVKYGNGIAYDRYYTDMVIIGLPDAYVEDLRREWEQKVAEANALVQKLADEIRNVGNIGSPDDEGGTGTIFGKVREVAMMLGLGAYEQGSMSIYEEVEAIRRLIGQGVQVDLTPVLTAIAESKAVIDTTSTGVADLKKRVPSNFPTKLAQMLDAAETAAGGVGIDTGGEDWTLHDKIGEKPENEDIFSILGEIRNDVKAIRNILEQS